MKRILSIVVLLAMCFMCLTACGDSKEQATDPARLARRYSNKGFDVRMFITDEEIEDVIEGIVTINDIECIFMVESPYSSHLEQDGIFIYCTNLTAAEKLSNYFMTRLGYQSYYNTDATVEGIGTFIFAGSKSLWEDVQA